VMGYHDAFFVAFLLLLIPFALAFTINDKTAEETLRRRVEAQQENAQVGLATAQSSQLAEAHQHFEP